MEKKVGIVTFHRAANYGAVLQAFALQTILKQLGLECKILDLRKDRVDLHYSGKFPKWSFKKDLIFSMKSYIYMIKEWPKSRKKRKIFDAFLDQYLQLSEVCDTDITLAIEEKKFDYFLCGSDQVWNLGSTEDNTNYFLQFAPPHKRNAYGASLGTARLSPQQKEKYRGYLEGFSHISLREKASLQEVQELIGGKGVWVLDPALLLPAESWKRFMLPVPTIPEQYILVYMLYDVENEQLIDFIHRLSREKGLPVVVIGKNKKIRINNKIEILPTPMQWVWLFYAATYVITNSYHGTIFSINFQKNFFTGYLLPLERPANIRMQEILQYLQLEHRRVQYEDIRHWQYPQSEDDWSVYQEKINNMREISLDFLDTVNGAYG